MSIVGTVSRGEQMTPEEWNNARHKVGESEWVGGKREHTEVATPTKNGRELTARSV